MRRYRADAIPRRRLALRHAGLRSSVALLFRAFARRTQLCGCNLCRSVSELITALCAILDGLC